LKSLDRRPGEGVEHQCIASGRRPERRKLHTGDAKASAFRGAGGEGRTRSTVPKPQPIDPPPASTRENQPRTRSQHFHFIQITDAPPGLPRRRSLYLRCLSPRPALQRIAADQPSGSEPEPPGADRNSVDPPIKADLVTDPPTATKITETSQTARRPPQVATLTPTTATANRHVDAESRHRKSPR
jgi:hypothetical protein